ncbi:sulfotransferase [Nocardioides bigeumensis]|uniref:Sulfotransferase n=1 Tax=Nocardioides bigeumensis TaxID=433657 RepID=A0ABN2YYJ3_9ACTN
MSGEQERARELGRIPITASIVGVQKAATSTMHAMLVRHRLVAPTFQNDPARQERNWHFANKELHFFDDEERDWSAPDYSHYYGSRMQEQQTIAVDATPSYVMWPGALARMRAYNPDMLLVASFRDPIERAFSQWSMGRGQRNPYPEFRDAIEQFDDESMLDHVPPGAGRWSVHRRSMVIRGLYGAQLVRGLAQFPREQWLMLNFSEWVRDYTAALDAITDHLGLHRFRRYPPLGHNPTPEEHTGVPPTADDIERLVARYADDLTLFEQLSGLDVSSWPTRRIATGSMPAEELADKFARRFVPSS